MTRTISTRISQKHDLEINWLKAVHFIPMAGELIIYDLEIDAEGNTLTNSDGSLKLPAGRTEPYTYERFKIGDGISTVNALPFIDETITVSSEKVVHEDSLLSDLINAYILNIDYDAFAFDTNEIVFNTAILDSAILDQTVLA